MPFSFAYRSGARHIVAIGTGKISVNDAIEAIVTVRPTDLKQFGLLLDLTAADPWLNYDDLMRLLDLTEQRHKSRALGAVAVVIRESSQRWMWRLFVRLAQAEGVNVFKVFDTMRQAAAWLNARPPSRTLTR